MQNSQIRKSIVGIGIRGMLMAAVLVLVGCESEQPQVANDLSAPTQMPSPKEPSNVTVDRNSEMDNVVTLPFVLTPHNNWLFEVKLNSADDLTLMFHTAASAVMLTKEGVATKTSTLNFDEKASLQTWGGEHDARVATSVTLKIGPLEWEGITVTEDLNSGRLSDGKFGPNLFEGKVLDFDFEKQELRIRDSLPELDDYEKFPFTVEHESMFLKTTLEVGGQMLEHNLMVHSGFGGALLLDTQFVQSHDLESQLEVVGTRELTDSMGNKLQTKQCRVPSVSLGALRLEDVPLEIFDGKIKEQRWSVLGGDVLKRFDMVIDRDNLNIYLKKNALAALPFDG